MNYDRVRRYSPTLNDWEYSKNTYGVLEVSQFFGTVKLYVEPSTGVVIYDVFKFEEKK